MDGLADLQTNPRIPEEMQINRTLRRFVFAR